MMEIYTDDAIYELPNAAEFERYGDGLILIQDNNWDAIAAVSAENVDVVAAEGEVIKKEGNSNK